MASPSIITLLACFWEGQAVDAVQTFVDETLGDSSKSLCYAAEESAAFAELSVAIAAPSAPLPA